MKNGEKVGVGQPVHTISQAAVMSGVHKMRIRNWEEYHGLISPFRAGKGNGRRLYSQNDIKRIKLIAKLADRDGMSLSDIRRFLGSEPLL